MMQKTKFSFALSLLALSTTARAEIYLDQDPDPLPMVEMTVVMPVGFESSTAKDAGVANLLSDLIDGGTAKQERQTFVEHLAEYGASVDFSVSNQYSQYSLSFPIVAGKNYDGLISLLQENWQTPRFDQRNFEIAKKKLEAALQSSLDSDFSLAGGASRRWINVKSFNGFPTFVGHIPEITLPQVVQLFERDFVNLKDIWAGVVAPASSSEMVKKLLTSVFSKQGAIKEKAKLKLLETKSEKRASFSAKKELLILDKDQRTQTVTSVIAISREDLRANDELAFTFANHVLFDSGLASVFSDEIRTKRGLAYSVGSGLKQFYGKPVLSVSMNPVKEKSDEALQTLSQLLKGSFEDGSIFKDMPQDVYDRQLRSFKNSKTLSQATPGSRLEERSAVVSGAESIEFFSSDPTKWNPSKEDLIKITSKLWKNSHVVIALVGEVKDLKPLAEKYFADYKITVIPYKDVVLEKAYR